MDVEHTTQTLLEQEDTDKDCRITIDDNGPKAISLGTEHSDGIFKYPIRGNYAISTLLQELSLAASAKQRRLVIQESELCQNPVDRINKMISKYFWHSLTRTIDQKGLELICLDAKSSDSTVATQRIYVSESDQQALQYFSNLKIAQLEIIQLPSKIDTDTMTNVLSKPGILALSLRKSKNISTGEQLEGVPFVVPGGRFNEMYGWDSYFVILGLLADNFVDLAKGMVDNLVYEIKFYGKILNANRSYYLGRSQPPFLTDAIMKVFERIDQKDEQNILWLIESFQWAIKEYENVWMKEPRYVPSHGLSRYCSEIIGVSPETEASHFDFVFGPFASKSNLSIEEYRLLYTSGNIKEPQLDEYFFHDQSLRESGHDTTYRLDGVSAHLLNFDLNFLLFKYECDIANFITRFSSLINYPIESVEVWKGRMEVRRQSINKYLWNEEDGLFYDYNFVTNTQSHYRSCTNFYSLWSGFATQHQADKILKNIGLFEQPGGLVSGTKDSLFTTSTSSPMHSSIKGPNRQWDYPFGWAPHQIIAWEGLSRYGFSIDSSRLAYKWLLMITKIFCNFNGTLAEKYNVVKLTHKITVEYGNVGIDFKFVPKEGFGWVNSSYRIGQSYLSKGQLKALGILMPADKLFDLT